MVCSSTQRRTEKFYMTESFGKHAIVIGAGMGGLSAAAAISGHFDAVTVLERDAFPDGVSPRSGAPQSRHLHVLLTGGLHALIALFPGFDRDLDEAGAVSIRMAREAREELPGFDPFPQRDLGWTLQTMSRPLLEWLVRRRVSQLNNVTLRERCRVLSLVPGSDASSVAGLRLRDGEGAEEMLPADLVIDASGRGTLIQALLDSIGRPLPEETEIGIDMTYTSTIFAIPEGHRDWKALVTVPEMPADATAGYLVPIEGSRWIICLTERHGGMPSADEKEFMERASQLRTTTLYDAIKNAKRVGEIHRFAFPENSWRHYEQLTKFPRGLLPLGDTICRFNPIYGQGMTVAIQEAHVLRDLLHGRVGQSNPLASVAEAFFTAVQPKIMAAWSSAAVPDFIHPQTRGEPPADLPYLLRFGRALLNLAARDVEVQRKMLAVRHLVEPQTVFHEPELVRRIEAEMADRLTRS
jgi:2-polyprenyl-6-methoxyphenol hydroxylase-like FAD-dependent oxidoreductase